MYSCGKEDPNTIALFDPVIRKSVFWRWVILIEPDILQLRNASN
jgi:hypothetical protein